MELSGEIFVPASRAQVFQAIRDPRVVVGCIEGVRELEEIDASHLRALMETKVGFIRLKFKVEVELLEVAPNDRVRLQIQGLSIGVVGRLRATSSTELVFTGKLGSIGQAAMKAKTSELEAQFASKLATVLSP